MRFPSFRLCWNRSVLTFLMALFAGFCLADSPLRAHEDEHEFAEALKAGDIMPLDRLLTRIRQDVGGRVLKVELEHEPDDEKPIWIYEAKVLTPEGHVLKLEYDAKTLALREVRGRHESHQHDDDD